MDKLYKNNEVFYFAIDQDFMIKPDQLNNYKDDVTKEDERKVWKKFPFSEGAPKWVIAYLRQWNNWKNVKDVIRYCNFGGLRLKDPPNQRRMGFL